MMMIVLLGAKTQSFSCKTFHSAHVSGCSCMVLAKYLSSLLLLQCNFWCKLLLSINSSSQANLKSCNKVHSGINSSEVFYVKPHGFLAQDILTQSLQQIYNCHKINLKVKIDKFAGKNSAKSMLGSRQGF